MLNVKTMKTNKSHGHDKARVRSAHIAPRLPGKDYQRSATRTWGLKAGTNYSSWLRSQGVKNSSEQTLTALFVSRAIISRGRSTLYLENQILQSVKLQEHDLILKQCPQKPRPLLHGVHGFALRALCRATAPVSSRFHYGWWKAGLPLTMS